MSGNARKNKLPVDSLTFSCLCCVLIRNAITKVKLSEIELQRMRKVIERVSEATPTPDSSIKGRDTYG